MKLDRATLRRPLTTLAGLLALGCGLTGLLGWHGGDPALTQLLPEFTPLSVSASVYLVGLGFGWLAASVRRFRLSAAVGTGLPLFALAASVPGFDGVFLGALGPLAAASATFQSGPTDFSPFTATVAVLLAFQLLLCSAGRFRHVGSLAGLLAPAVACLGLSSLPWGVTFAAFGLAPVGLLDVRRPRRSDLARAIRLVPALAMIVSAAATVTLWRAVAADEQARTARLIEAETDEAMQQVRSGFPRLLQHFDDLTKTWHRNGADRAEMHNSVGGILGMVQSAAATYWADAEGQLGWLETGQRFRPQQGVLDEEWQDAMLQFLAEARNRDEWSVTSEGVEPLFGQHLLLAFFPSPARDRSGLLVVFSAQEFLGSIFPDNRQKGSVIDVRSGPIRLARHGELADWMTEVAPQEFSYNPLPSVNWTIRIWPTQALLAKERSTMALSTLLAGLVMTGFLGLTSYLFLRSRAQARQVAQSDARSHALISNLQQAVYLKDQELKYVSVNRVFCDQAGRPESAILGRTDEELFPAEVARRIHDEESRILREGVRQEREESVVVDGKPQILQVMRSPVRDAAGKVTGVLGVRWDVTDQRQLEIQLRQSQKMDALGKLAGGIAHDFNNLLTVMIGNLYLMRDGLVTGEDSVVLIQEAEKAANRAAELVRQLLSFSRQTPIRFEPVELPSVIAEVARLVRRTIDAKVRIDVAVPDELWTIQGDVGQLHQVLMNLCINARDAMPEGGLLRVTASNVALSQNQIQGRIDARAGDFVRLTVSDNGTGMTPEVRGRIFEPFFTTKGVGKGTGLGLAQVFGIAQQHQGWIECRSSPGAGTIFDLFFPRSGEASVNNNSVTQAVRSGSETILVIDDESMIRNLVKRIFNSAGYRVLTASDGKEGIETYRSRTDVDLIVLDLNMPGLSGQETFRELLRHDPAVRVVISSGYSEEHLNTREANLVAAFLAKPFRSDVLLRVVREVLDSNPNPRPSPKSAASDCETVTNF